MSESEGQVLGRISGWGGYPVIDGQISCPNSVEEMTSLVRAGSPCLPRGQGRAYGDAALASRLLGTRHLDCIVDFDIEQGVITAEAGITLSELARVSLPFGWFLAVTPGTSFASLGGAIAADVHGKNHHDFGGFSQSVLSLDLLGSEGDIVSLSPERNSDLFHATFGAMGLTGVVVRATIQLIRVESPYIRETNIACHNLDELVNELNQRESTYSVAWVDLFSGGDRFGRALLSLGEHEPAADPKALSVPQMPVARSLPTLPGRLALRDLTMTLFNATYFARGARKAQSKKVGLGGYFYPLDALADWNQWYGPRGFIQYQLVLPEALGADGMRAVYQAVKGFKQRPYLCVLKLMGGQNASSLSFPMAGLTLAMDFPRRKEVEQDLSKLDNLVQELGGRVYLAKDALSSRNLFRSGYPDWEQFAELRARNGADRVFRSALSDRLGV